MGRGGGRGHGGRAHGNAHPGRASHTTTTHHKSSVSGKKRKVHHSNSGGGAHQPWAKEDYTPCLITFSIFLVIFAAVFVVLFVLLPFFLGVTCDGIENVTLGQFPTCHSPLTGDVFFSGKEGVTAYEFSSVPYFTYKNRELSYDIKESIGPYGYVVFNISYPFVQAPFELSYHYYATELVDIGLLDETEYKQWVSGGRGTLSGVLVARNVSEVAHTGMEDGNRFLVIKNPTSLSLRVKETAKITGNSSVLDVDRAVSHCDGPCTFVKPHGNIIVMQYEGEDRIADVIILNDYSLNVGFLLGVIVSGALFVIVLITIFGLCICKCKAKSRKEIQENMEQGDVAMTTIGDSNSAGTDPASAPYPGQDGPVASNDTV